MKTIICRLTLLFIVLGCQQENANAQSTPVSSRSYKDCKIVGITSIRGNKEVCVMDYDGSNLTNLTNTPIGFAEDHPSWSPDGKKIMYCTETTRSRRTKKPDYAGEIYVMNADGSSKQNLTNNPALDFRPSWSPDSKRIVFVSNRDGNAEIYVMNADGSEQKRLTNNSGGEQDPSWSPDGNKIVFSSTRDRKKNDRNVEIYVMNADGTDQRNLTNNSARDDSPSWSPDGKRIAFNSERDGNQDIYIIDRNGRNLQRITTYSESDQFMGWSPDGSKIAFISNREKWEEKSYMNMLDFKPFIVDVESGDVKKILEILPAGGLLWSPDGKKIMTSGGEDLYLISPDGRGPDSEKIMYSIGNKMYLVSPGGKGVERFVDKALGNMSWSPLPTETGEKN